MKTIITKQAVLVININNCEGCVDENVSGSKVCIGCLNTIPIEKQVKKVKTKEIKINALKLENGHIIIGCSDGIHFVKTEDGIMQYTNNEMLEIYELDFS